MRQRKTVIPSNVLWKKINMLGHKLEYLINKAIRKANALRHEYLTLECVLWILLEDKQIVDLLENHQVNVTRVREELGGFLKNEKNFSILTEEKIQELIESQFLDEDIRAMAKKAGINYQPEISMALQRVLQRAVVHVQSSGKNHVHGLNILVAMFHEKESYGIYLLRKQGLEQFNIVNSVAHGVDRAIADGGSELTSDGEATSQRTSGYLSRFSTDLNKLYRQGRMDPLVGRENELTRIVRILCRRRKNNPLLVGEAGVGKTAIAYGLAAAIEQKKVPHVLRGVTIHGLDVGSLLAGAKFRGDFEQRFKGLMKDIQNLRKAGKNIVIFIDEIHTVMGTGSTGGAGGVDASNLLKTAFDNDGLRCMGSTTYDEYRKYIEKDSGFGRRFQIIDVEEPSREETVQILQGLRSRFEKHHKVKYPNHTLKMAIELSHRYISDRKLPDKAIDVIDDAGAAVQLLPDSIKRINVTKTDIENTISSMAKVPRKSVVGGERELLASLKKNLQLLIFGQDEVIEKIVDTIVLSRSGLGRESRPIGKFLFAGPTGVGKTELSRQLALNLGVHFQRFDMSEYMEKHSISKLIGSPPGYVGHDQGGLLTDAISKNPYCVLLLDEIEKGHGDIFNVLLQVMDYGKLTDSQGRTTDFQNVILIMTTNLGTQEMEKGSIGIVRTAQDSIGKRDQAIKNFLSPEFRNRLDSTLHFSSLSREHILGIVDKFIYELESKLAAKGVEFVLKESARMWLAHKGHDPKMGARPIERLIDNEIKRPLSKKILFGSLKRGGKVIVSIKENKPVFHLHAIHAKKVVEEAVL